MGFQPLVLVEGNCETAPKPLNRAPNHQLLQIGVPTQHAPESFGLRLMNCWEPRRNKPHLFTFAWGLPLGWGEHLPRVRGPKSGPPSRKVRSTALSQNLKKVLRILHKVQSAGGVWSGPRFGLKKAHRVPLTELLSAHLPRLEQYLPSPERWASIFLGWTRKHVGCPFVFFWPYFWQPPKGHQL